MKRLTWTIVLIFLLLTGLVSAHFYLYIDQNGNLRFVDDLNNVNGLVILPRFKPSPG